MTSGVLVEGDGAQVTEDVMSTWLENVWFRHVHTAQSTQKILLEKDSCLAIIPNACSAKVQPLHQGLKEKFKAGLEEKYLNSASGLSKPEVRPNPNQEQILAWVDQVFHDLRQNKREIAESFRKTEIYCRAADK